VKKIKHKYIIILSITILIIVIVSLLVLSRHTVNTVSINEIQIHPYRYINKSVTVKGYYYLKLDIPDEQISYYIQGDDFLTAYIPKDIDTSILINGAEYYWIGLIIKEGEGIRLIVKDIQSI